MLKIWKYQFTPDSIKDGVYKVSVYARKNARAISVGIQGKHCCVWFEVDPNEQHESLMLYVVGTGFGVVPENKRFLGTVIQGDYVWHIYCDKE